MNKPGLLNRLILGIQHYPWKFLIGVFIAYSVIWTILEPLLAFFPDFQSGGIFKYTLMVLLSLAAAASRIIPETEVSFHLPGTNTNVQIFFGDLFAQEGDIAIAANEYFDCDMEVIKEFSLHGKFIQKYMPEPEAFTRQVDESLARNNIRFRKVKRTDVRGNVLTRNKRYDIGTTAMINLEGKRFFFFALTRNPNGKGGEANAADLWQSLTGLWQEIRYHRQSARLNIPLVGSGYSDIGLADMQLIHLIIASIAAASRQGSFTQEIRLVLWPDKIKTVNLEKVADAWR